MRFFKNKFERIRFLKNKDYSIYFHYLFYKNNQFFKETDFSSLKLSLRGLNDYYFLINDSNQEIRQHFDKYYKNNFNSKKFSKNIHFKREVFKRNDIEYYYFVVPDKSVVCKDLLPFEYTFLKRDIDNIDDFVDFADKLDVSDYFPLDSHINYDGGRLLTFYILNFIDKSFSFENFDDLLNDGADKLIIHTFDLLTERNWSYSESEKNNFSLTENITIKIPKNFIDAHSEIPNEFNFDGVRKTEFFKNQDSFSKKRVLIFRDSSANLLKWFFSFYFEEILFYWDHGNLNPKVIKWFNPDIIIELRTERLLDNIPVPSWIENKEYLNFK